MFPPSFFDHLEDRLNLAVYDTNEEHRLRFDLQRMSKSDLVKELDRGDVAAGTTDRTTQWVDDQVLEVNWPEKQYQPVGLLSEVRMTPIERIKSKALQAKDIAPQAIRDFEADLDGILAEKNGLEQKRIAAVAPHKEAISGIYSEIDGLKHAMDILSNGGPPLTESEPAAEGSKAGV